MEFVCQHVVGVLMPGGRFQLQLLGGGAFLLFRVVCLHVQQRLQVFNLRESTVLSLQWSATSAGGTGWSGGSNQATRPFLICPPRVRQPAADVSLDTTGCAALAGCGRGSGVAEAAVEAQRVPLATPSQQHVVAQMHCNWLPLLGAWFLSWWLV